MKRTATTTAVIALALLLLAPAAFGAPRKVLAEMFTSTTCAPCYPADVFYFQTWLPNYPGRDQIITIAYHVWWPSPGNDPMYLANTAPVQARVAFCQGSPAYAPWMVIDGSISGGSSYTSWPGIIESRFLFSSPIAIVLTGSRNGSTLQMNARITAEQAVNSANWRVQWVVVEDSIPAPQNSGGTYVPFAHEFVHRAMLPDANGTAITISQGQTVNMPRTITMNAGWRPEKLKVVVFVQDMATKAVQNAEIIPVGVLTGAGEAAETPARFALGQNYPNPFNPSTTIAYELPEESFVTLSVFNLLGQELRTILADLRGGGSHTAVWDGLDGAGREVPSGTYIYRLSAGRFQESRRMMLVR
jgi:hypothetical protein